METAIYICIITGLFVNSMSIIGFTRFPDVYTKLHAATKTTTFGSIFITAGLMLYNTIHDNSGHIIILLHSGLALLVIIFTNPISAHAIARASLSAGVKPFGLRINGMAVFNKKKEDI